MNCPMNVIPAVSCGLFWLTRLRFGSVISLTGPPSGPNRLSLASSMPPGAPIVSSACAQLRPVARERRQVREHPPERRRRRAPTRPPACIGHPPDAGHGAALSRVGRPAVARPAMPVRAAAPRPVAARPQQATAAECAAGLRWVAHCRRRIATAS